MKISARFINEKLKEKNLNFNLNLVFYFQIQLLFYGQPMSHIICI
jgi:hypothetical protein